MIYHNHINGWVPSLKGATYNRESPSDTRITVGKFADSVPADIRLACEAGQAAQSDWAACSMVKRGEVLAKAARTLQERAASIAADLASETGKPNPEALGEVLRTVEVFDYLASLGRQSAGTWYESSRPGVRVLTMRSPRGVVGVITPFNFPAFVSAFKIGAGLMAGNAVVWKPSPTTPLTGVRIVEVFLEAGLPPGLLSYVTGTAAELGASLIREGAIRAVSFTGSTVVGKLVEAAAVERGIPAQVEMGGYNALVVLDDADLDRAADAVIDGAFGGAGQKCTATRRVYVQEGVARPLTDLILERAKAWRERIQSVHESPMGPLIDAPSLEKYCQAIEHASQAGANILCGGKRIVEGDFAHGYFVEPCVLTNVPSGIGLSREEVFGPVVTLTPVSSLEEALDCINGSKYGLSSALFTRDMTAVDVFARLAEVGSLNVNLPTTGVEPHVPFGGVKDSGSGPRELGPGALDFYSYLRTMAISPVP